MVKKYKASKEDLAEFVRGLDTIIGCMPLDRCEMCPFGRDDEENRCPKNAVIQRVEGWDDMDDDEQEEIMDGQDCLWDQLITRLS